MTRAGKTPSQAGFEPWIFRSRGGRFNHLANEAVVLMQAHDDICLRTDSTVSFYFDRKLAQRKGCNFSTATVTAPIFFFRG